MLAMRWKNKAFGSKKRGTRFGSIRISPTGDVTQPTQPTDTSIDKVSASSTGSGNAEVANALADAKKEAMADMASILKGDAGPATNAPAPTTEAPAA